MEGGKAVQNPVHSAEDDTGDGAVIAGAVVGASAGVVLVGAGVWCQRRKMRRMGGRATINIEMRGPPTTATPPTIATSVNAPSSVASHQPTPPPVLQHHQYSPEQQHEDD